PGFRAGRTEHRGCAKRLRRDPDRPRAGYAAAAAVRDRGRSPCTGGGCAGPHRSRPARARGAGVAGIVGRARNAAAGPQCRAAFAGCAGRSARVRTFGAVRSGDRPG
ncbi:MAG: hypothetical protein ACK56I_32090, partial [bacterium]